MFLIKFPSGNFRMHIICLFFLNCKMSRIYNTSVLLGQSQEGKFCWPSNCPCINSDVNSPVNSFSSRWVSMRAVYLSSVLGAQKWIIFKYSSRSRARYKHIEDYWQYNVISALLRTGTEFKLIFSTIVPGLQGSLLRAKSCKFDPARWILYVPNWYIPLGSKKFFAFIFPTLMRRYYHDISCWTLSVAWGP